MKKKLKRRLLLCLFLIAMLATGCIPEGEFRLVPVGGGGSSGGRSFIDWWQGKTPTQPVQVPAGATGLAKAEASPSPEPSPEASTVPQAVPPPALESIAGVQEVHNASSPLTCRQMQQRFQQQGLRLTLTAIIPIDQPGRRGAPRARSRRVPGRRDTSSTYGRMFICLFEGQDAVTNRYGVNDDYTNSGLEPPDFSQDHSHPNDYRNPDPTPTIEPGNPNRPTVPDPDPKRPNPYDDLPY